jgi:hypothetical protein
MGAGGRELEFWKLRVPMTGEVRINWAARYLHAAPRSGDDITLVVRFVVRLGKPCCSLVAVLAVERVR